MAPIGNGVIVATLRSAVRVIISGVGFIMRQGTWLEVPEDMLAAMMIWGASSISLSPSRMTSRERRSVLGYVYTIVSVYGSRHTVSTSFAVVVVGVFEGSTSVSNKEVINVSFAVGGVSAIVLSEACITALLSFKNGLPNIASNFPQLITCRLIGKFVFRKVIDVSS